MTDIAKSTEHYRDVLGFTVTFEYALREDVRISMRIAVSINELAGL